MKTNIMRLWNGWGLYISYMISVETQGKSLRDVYKSAAMKFWKVEPKRVKTTRWILLNIYILLIYTELLLLFVLIGLFHWSVF